MAFHTAYDYHGGHLHSRPVEADELKNHDDTYNMNIANDTHKAHYSEADKHTFMHHINAAEKYHHQQNYDVLHPVKDHISTYINKTVRNDETPSTSGLASHIRERGLNAASKMKTEKSKQAKIDAHEALASHVEVNNHHFDNYFKLHHHLQKAKNVLVNTLDNADHAINHHIRGEKSAPEGYVFRNNGEQPIKLVNRSHFSKSNFKTQR